MHKYSLLEKEIAVCVAASQASYRTLQKDLFTPDWQNIPKIKFTEQRLIQKNPHLLEQLLDSRFLSFV